jgi:hypothetical protein
MDIVFIVAIVAFAWLTWSMTEACARLEERR